MQTAKIHSVETLGALDGPGIRYVLFLHGCPFRCKFCHNPDTWKSGGFKTVSSSEIFEDVAKYADFFKFSKGGFTASGGEPLMQKKFLIELFGRLKSIGVETAVDTCGYADIDEDTEELALTLNGKKRKLRKADFIKSMTASGVDEKVIDNIERRFSRTLPKWFELIDRSFLPEDMCKTYKNLILRRMIMLK